MAPDWKKLFGSNQAPQWDEDGPADEFDELSDGAHGAVLDFSTVDLSDLGGSAVRPHTEAAPAAQIYEAPMPEPVAQTPRPYGGEERPMATDPYAEPVARGAQMNETWQPSSHDVEQRSEHRDSVFDSSDLKRLDTEYGFIDHRAYPPRDDLEREINLPPSTVVAANVFAPEPERVSPVEARSAPALVHQAPAFSATKPGPEEWQMSDDVTLATEISHRLVSLAAEIGDLAHAVEELERRQQQRERSLHAIVGQFAALSNQLASVMPDADGQGSYKHEAA